MVREREQPSPGRTPNNETAPKSRPLHGLVNPPEFGQASPLRNTLQKVFKKAESSIFNIPAAGKPRPEHHRPQQAPGQPRSVSSSSTSSQYSNTAFNPYANHATQPPPVFRAPPPMHTAGSATHRPEVYEVPRPAAFRPRTTYPTAQPEMFSSRPFQPLNRVYPPTLPIDLTKDDGEEFDPDRALRNDRFGAPDPYQYVDASRATEDIKALLEGAFDDDEEKPRLRRRKVQKKEAAPAASAKSLEDRLKSLKVKEEAKEQEQADEEDEEEDGTVEGLACKLLPHQVEGVAWMNDREMSTKKKNGVLPKGGILADDMGLGKTIQSVALMLQNPRPSKEEAEKDKKNQIPPSCSKCTLVVAPLALIKQWEAEIKDKVERSHKLRVLVSKPNCYESKCYGSGLTFPNPRLMTLRLWNFSIEAPRRLEHRA
jgi:hypothetical protein